MILLRVTEPQCIPVSVVSRRYAQDMTNIFASRFPIAIAIVAMVTFGVVSPISPLADSSDALTMVQSGEEGDTPFVGEITITGVPRSATEFGFTVVPKSGSFAAPAGATYSRKYLTRNGYFVNPTTAVIPVFGLYENYLNTVNVSVRSNNGKPRVLPFELSTSRWSSDCRSNLVRAEKVVEPSASVPLDFSYYMLKAWSCDAHPIVMDIDGNVRWTGTVGGAQQGSAFFNNNFYVGNGSDLYEISMFGESTNVGNYADEGYADYHHNIDPGRTGMLLEFNKYPDVESDIVEVNAQGRILSEWDFAAIVRDAMIDGGDDPSNFVRQGDDWLHNNAATYWPQKNQLVISAREDFVMAVGYDDHEIKWILGDPDKAWYDYPSLRAFALTLTPGSEPPIGQHAVSFTSSGNLMLFDNGFESFNHWPAGSSRSESVPRQYSLDLKKKRATEVWTYHHTEPIWSPICSSIYEFGSSYLIDYASEDGGIRLVGIDKRKRIGFELKVTGSDFTWGWNALPISLSKLRFR